MRRLLIYKAFWEKSRNDPDSIHILQQQCIMVRAGNIYEEIDLTYFFAQQWQKVFHLGPSRLSNDQNSQFKAGYRSNTFMHMLLPDLALSGV